MSDWKKGGKFLFTKTEEDIFTFEDFDEESQLIADTAAKFGEHQALPRKAEMVAESTRNKTNVEILRQAGELGLLMVEIPEEYGGLGLDLSTTMLVAESAAKEASFATTMMCHTGIGTLPILYFGTPEQKETYLPKLATGEWCGAYALTEAGYGSDALGAKTTAKLSEDGKHWILNGSKMFITNAGFADVYSVYAKIDGEDFSAFIVEADTPGLSTGNEEHKMGIKGSSTRELLLDEVKIPVDNLLGKKGKGHRVALNILNLGRLKLGFGSLGGCRETLKQCLQYSAERKQFGKTINSFQMIKKKLANMATEIFALESMGYRCSGDIDKGIAAIDVGHDDPTYMEKKVACLEEFAIEASIIKVSGSEAQARVVDEGVQLFGGYGFIEEYPVCGAYRDARIMRLFEGTNEINRMVIPGTIMRRAMKQQLDLMTPVMTLMGEIKAESIPKDPQAGALGREATAIDIMRRWATLGYGVPAQKAMADQKFMQKNQIILEQLADLSMDVYAAESAYLRTKKMISKDGEDTAQIPIKLTQVIVYEKLRTVMEIVRQICANCAASDEEFIKNTKAMHRLGYNYGLNTMALKEEIADHFIDRERYTLV
ncbi:MAG: acyl-CoA dehydrogenase family protein [Myxococcota bacterium]|nr:acyl-CoA dehydrogenase family protein [Myxococcota bacterium]